MGAVLLAGVAVVAYAFDTFETKERSKERVEVIQGQMNRLEDKFDDYFEVPSLKRRPKR